MEKLKARLKTILIKAFAKYCVGCDGRCCRSVVVTLFDQERDSLLAIKRDICTCNERGSISDMDISNGCPFLRKDGCSLENGQRPFDCVTFPCYPIVGRYGDLVAILVHNSCPRADDIAHDRELMGVVRSFWVIALEEDIEPEDLARWKGEGESDPWNKYFTGWKVSVSC